MLYLPFKEQHIFENLIIYANDVGSGIFIENTDLYFKIINCTIFDSGFAENDAGIKLMNTMNGNLINNSIQGSNYAGISVLNNQEIELRNNEILNAREIGLCVDGSVGIVIYNNTISFSKIGILLLHSNDIYVTLNLIAQCQTNIFEYGCSNTFYEDNSFLSEIFIEIIDQSFSPESFLIKFMPFDKEGQKIEDALIVLWWDGIDYSSDVQNHGNGFYSILLAPIILSPGEDPVLLNMTISASNYNDKYFETKIGVYEEETAGPIIAIIDIDPDTLNTGSKGKWITVYIELPEGYYVNEIDIGSILLNGILHIADSSPNEIGDYDKDGISDLMVKFDRSEVIK